MLTTLRSLSTVLTLVAGIAIPACVNRQSAVQNGSAVASPSQTPTPDTAPIVSGYNQPPQNVLDVLRATPSARPSISPTYDKMLLISGTDYPSIAQVAEPFLKLAGVRVEPRTRRKHDTDGGYGVAPCAIKFVLLDVASSQETPLQFPPNGCADGVTWSADGKQFAFRNTSKDAVELWIGDVATATLKRLGNVRLNPMLGSSVQWMADQKTLLVKLVPNNAGPPPATGAVVIDGPRIQQTDGQTGESSTYETRDTLASKHDEALFEYYATSQLALIDAASSQVTPIGAPAIFTDLNTAPDNQHFLVNTIQKPFSYVTTYENFGQNVDVWDRSGRSVASIAKLPVADRVPVRGVPTGPRDFQWRPTEPATLLWTEALDGGDWNTKVPARDKVMRQKAPFQQPAAELLRTEQRFAGMYWAQTSANNMFVEYDANRNWIKTSRFDPDAPSVKPTVIWDRSTEDIYNAPGSPVFRILPNGGEVIKEERGNIFLSSQGASPEGNRPFLDRFDLNTKSTQRLFRSERNALEYFVAFTGTGQNTFLTWHQSPIDPPNAKLRTIGEKAKSPASGESLFISSSKAVTHIPDPTPQVRAIKKRLVKYKRADGIELSFTLYTPPNYQEGTRMPAILNAYPTDYASTKGAGQVSGSEQTFTRLSNYRLLLLSGYAIIDQAAFPIVGDPTKAYDTYLEQLVANAKAAVDKAVELGVVDKDRIGVTGHSHGALMTVNLLAHTDLFRAGAATSGAYNKTLTPFGFQSERRSVWKAPEVYQKVSPFFVADKIKRPLLIVHGQDDANPGTTPLQSVKLFEAIRGNGGNSRLVMLPHEPHWYAAMESNEQLAYEELAWFDKYVKNAVPVADMPTPTQAGR
jgi:dipeptidyl aminopeptidase/acylaminoacyl peptidase